MIHETFERNRVSGNDAFQGTNGINFYTCVLCHGIDEDNVEDDNDHDDNKLAAVTT